MSIPNTTHRLLVERLGGTDPSVFIGNEGEVFYDPDASSPTLRLSDGSTAGGIAIGGTGGGGSIAGIDTAGTSTFNNLNVTGVSTLSNTIIGGGTTELVVNGDARITGILTIGTASITIDGTRDYIRLGSPANPVATIDNFGNVFFSGGLKNEGPVGGAYYYEPWSMVDGIPITIRVTTSIKTNNHRYNNIGATTSYYLDGVEAPFLSVIPGKIYLFNQEDESNTTYPISFYTDEARTNPYVDGVFNSGTPGLAGAETLFFPTEFSPSILYYEGGDFIGGQIQIVGATNYSIEGKWLVGTAGTDSFTFTGIGFGQTTSNPVLYLARGKIYEFINNSDPALGPNPFEIRVSAGGTAYNDGVINNSAYTGTIRFEIPFDAPNTLYYQSTISSRSGMGNTIVVYPNLI